MCLLCPFFFLFIWSGLLLTIPETAAAGAGAGVFVAAEALQAEGEIGIGLSVGDVSLFAVSPEGCANELLLAEVVESLRAVLSSLCQ